LKRKEWQGRNWNKFYAEKMLAGLKVKFSFAETIGNDLTGVIKNY